MSSFEKLFVNSTNRLSAVKNIIVSQASPSLNTLQSHNNIQHFIPSGNSSLFKSCKQQQITQTFQQLQQRYQQLSKTIKEANQQKQIMTMLFEKIFQIEQGEENKLKKRFRRKKNEIQTKYACKLPNCKKVYSSSTSLARHIKLKHACQNFQPPQPNYQIPPQPNLNQSSELEKRDETQQNVKLQSEAPKDEDYQSDEDGVSSYDCQDDYREIALQEEEPS